MGKIAIILSLLFSSSLLANDLRPDHYVVQTGSYSGALTAGAGYETSIYSPQLLFGYVPKFLGGEDLYSATFKNILHPPSKFLILNSFTMRPYVGISLLYSILDSDTFVNQPSKYPDGYYPANGIRASIFSGYDIDIDSRSSFYFEVSALDLYTETYVRSDGALSLTEVTTYGFGIKVKIP